jgi:hypothetical protein
MFLPHRNRNSSFYPDQRHKKISIIVASEKAKTGENRICFFVGFEKCKINPFS